MTVKVITPGEYMKYYFSGYQVTTTECQGGLNEFLQRINLDQYKPVYELGFVVKSGNFFTAHLFKQGEKQSI